jgi:lipopolysaccharide export system protein LptA
MKRLPLLVLSVATALAGGAAQAQLNRATGPLGLSADGSVTSQETCQSTWKGRVEASQEQTRLRADQLDVYFQRKGPKDCGDYERLEATGNVYYVTPEVKARGDKAVYLASSSTITITGKVVVSSDQGVTETNRLVLNTNTNEATMGDTAPGQRVRAVIYPSKKPAAQAK